MFEDKKSLEQVAKQGIIPIKIKFCTGVLRGAEKI